MPVQTLASNIREARKLRMMMWIASALPIGACAWGAWKQDIGWYALAMLGAGCAAAMQLWLRRYVTSLELDGDTLIVRTLAFGSTVHRIDRKRVGQRIYNSGPGRMGTYTSTDAPWIQMDIEGFRRPFVIDAPIEVLDLDKIKSL